MTQDSRSTENLRCPNPTLVSVVAPLYNESANLVPLTEAIDEALHGLPYELILVDDGSTDGTLAVIEMLAARDARVAGLSLSRNFGHQYALAAGLSRARGQAIVTMDGDLQHPPALLPELVDKWRQGYNVVQALRRDSKKTGVLKRWTSRAFYRFFSVLSGIRIDPGASDYRLIDRVVLDELLKMHEGQLFLRGLLAWMGYREARVPYDAPARLAGKSKFTLRKMLRLAKSGLFSFTTVPLRIGIFVGLLTALLSFVELIYVCIVQLSGRAVPGWASTVGVLSLLFGVLFVLLGIQGEYIIRIYERVQHRPSFLIERVVTQRHDEGAAGQSDPE